MCSYLQEVNMDVVLNELEHVHTGNLFQKLKDAHTVGWVHVTF